MSALKRIVAEADADPKGYEKVNDFWQQFFDSVKFDKVNDTAMVEFRVELNMIDEVRELQEDLENFEQLEAQFRHQISGDQK